MNWDDALPLLLAKIKEGTKLDTNFNYKVVLQTPPYKCFKYDYNGEEGFKVSVEKNQYVEIPISMLKNIFKLSKMNDNCYDRKIFIANYPQQTIQRIGHIHIIGKMFVHAGIAVQTSIRTYTLL